jgi:phosphatidylethanolamine/phosphatidyl-N-methylethanolamine N-methyltransferase
LPKTQLYDETAKEYHGRYRYIQRIKYQVLASCSTQHPIIDVGIGTGIGLPSLNANGPIIGLDGSIEMLRIAQKEISKKAPWRTIVNLVCASAEAIPFRKQVFPTIVSVTVIQNLSDRKQGTREITRICQPEGRIFITALSKTLPLKMLELLFTKQFKVLKRFYNLANEDDGLLLKLNKP